MENYKEKKIIKKNNFLHDTNIIDYFCYPTPLNTPFLVESFYTYSLGAKVPQVAYKNLHK